MSKLQKLAVMRADLKPKKAKIVPKFDASALLEPRLLEN